MLLSKAVSKTVRMELITISLKDRLKHYIRINICTEKNSDYILNDRDSCQHKFMIDSTNLGIHCRHRQCRGHYHNAIVS